HFLAYFVVEPGEDLVRFFFDGGSGEAALDAGVLGEHVSGDGGVGGDDSGEGEVLGDADDFIDGLFGEVGGDFYEEGFGTVDFTEAPEDAGEVVGVLEFAEAGGVGG